LVCAWRAEAGGYIEKAGGKTGGGNRWLSILERKKEEDRCGGGANWSVSTLKPEHRQFAAVCQTARQTARNTNVCRPNFGKQENDILKFHKNLKKI
jgi:hypothetical protein